MKQVITVYNLKSIIFYDINSSKLAGNKLWPKARPQG